MPWIVLLLLLCATPQVHAQPVIAYGENLEVEKLVSELIVNSKTGPVLSLRNVKVNGQSNQLISDTGGEIDLSFDYIVHCKHCQPNKNQLILGLHFQHSAQACVKLQKRQFKSQPKSQSNWKSITVKIVIPHYQGNYYIRARHSAAFNCTDALDWWRFDQPHGPDSQANIAMVQIIRPQNITQANNPNYSLSDFSILPNTGANK